ncbi:MAG: hypothetical protein NTV73_11155 [Hyphomicrobiales bacterium]|nr:hypothetical protein [Hyphomicrobiales bacterium]
MIKTALVAMTIVGCDCDAKLCEFVSESPPQWTSVAECEAAAKSRVVRTPGLDYPLVTAICRSAPQNDAPAAAPVQLASLKHEDGHSLYGMVRDGGGFVRNKTAGGYALAKAGVSWTVDMLTPSAMAAWVPRVGR